MAISQPIISANICLLGHGATQTKPSWRLSAHSTGCDRTSGQDQRDGNTVCELRPLRNQSARSPSPRRGSRGNIKRCKINVLDAPEAIFDLLYRGRGGRVPVRGRRGGWCAPRAGFSVGNRTGLAAAGPAQAAPASLYAESTFNSAFDTLVCFASVARGVPMGSKGLRRGGRDTQAAPLEPRRQQAQRKVPIPRTR